MRCSIVIPTYNKSYALKRVLEAVRSQKPPFDYEVIVVNDGSSDDTEQVCEFYSTEYAYLDRPYPCGPALAKNTGYKMARGEILFCLNDDALMMTDDAIERMCDLKPRTYNAAYEDYFEADGSIRPGNPGIARLFFASTVLRKHVYAIGGCDEAFTMLNYEDTFMRDCLEHGRGVRAEWRDDVCCRQIFHTRPGGHWDGATLEQARTVYQELLARALTTGKWVASGGPWPYTEESE